MLCPENILSAVSKFRHDRSLPSFHGDSLNMPIQGGQCQIYRVFFADNVMWAVRLPTRLSSEAASQVLREENRILRRLQRSGFGWSPKFVGEELEHDNPVGFPFSVYEWIPGDPLTWTADTPSDRSTRKHFIDQLAKIQLALISCTRVDDPLKESFLDHVTRVIDHRIARICRGELLSLRVRDCFYHRNLIIQSFAEVNWCGPRFTGHNDLGPQNILVDNDLNISGILDWSFAAEEPFPLAAAMPRLLRPGQKYAGSVLEDDRKFLVESLRRQACPEHSDVVEFLAWLYSREGYEHLQRVLEAVGSVSSFRLLTRTFAVDVDIDEGQEIGDFLIRRGKHEVGWTNDLIRKYW